jgi:hypothetical protein
MYSGINLERGKEDQKAKSHNNSDEVERILGDMRGAKSGSLTNFVLRKKFDSVAPRSS